jgi:hypothetical protein
MHAPGRIRNHNPSKRLAVDTHLRPLGHWDRLSFQLVQIFSRRERPTLRNLVRPYPLALLSPPTSLLCEIRLNLATRELGVMMPPFAISHTHHLVPVLLVSCSVHILYSLNTFSTKFCLTCVTFRNAKTCFCVFQLTLRSELTSVSHAITFG